MSPFVDISGAQKNVCKLFSRNIKNVLSFVDITGAQKHLCKHFYGKYKKYIFETIFF